MAVDPKALRAIFAEMQAANVKELETDGDDVRVVFFEPMPAAPAEKKHEARERRAGVIALKGFPPGTDLGA